jgi:hypothetical protein
MHDGGGGIEIKQASIENADIILQIQIQAPSED